MRNKNKDQKDEDRSRHLRPKAEAKFTRDPKLPADMEKMSQEELIHELRVHQIELEMQNDELKSDQAMIEESRDKYAELYDFAPTGYFTLSRDVVILEANVATAMFLGVDHQKLINQRFRKFIDPADIDRWDRYIVDIFQHDGKGRCELALKRPDGSMLYVQIDSVRIDLPAAAGQAPEIVVRASMSDITERKKAEQAIKDTAYQFQAVVEFVGEGITFSDSSGKFLVYNLKMQKLTGFTVDEANNSGDFTRLLYPEPLERQKALQRLQEIVEHKVALPLEVETAIQAKDGTKKMLWVSTVEMRFKDQEMFLSIYRDITERKQSEKFRALSLYNRSLIEASLDPFVTINSEGNITDVNEATIKATGVSREKLMGTDFSDYFTEPEKAREGYHEVFSKGFVSNYPLAIRHKDGKIINVLYNATVYKDYGGNVLGVFAAARDVTKLNYLQDKLMQSEKLAVLGKLAGSVSHELRNPLGVIRNSIYFLKMKLGQDLKDEKIKRHLDILEEEIQISDRIINDILAFARIKEARLAETDINKIIESLLRVIKIPENIRIIPQLNSDLPHISADEVQLQQSFSNIMLNAVQAMPNGGELTIASRTNNEIIEVNIIDTGIGIAKEDLDKIFSPLFSTKAQGTGLGLTVCQGIIEIHGGSIEVESEMGKGTKFIVKLPINKSQNGRIN